MKFKFLKFKKAQIAMELALGGTVLIALVGAVITQAWNFSMEQNNTYRSMREALLLSYLYSFGLKHDFDTSTTIDGNEYYALPPHILAWKKQGSRSRASANYISCEDRLDIGNIDKVGSLNAQQFCMQRNGSHTNNMFMPIDWGEIHNLGRMDLFVNNQHFALTTNEFKIVDVGRDAESEYSECPTFWDPYCARVLSTKKFLKKLEKDPDDVVCDGTVEYEWKEAHFRCLTTPDGRKALYVGCRQVYDAYTNTPNNDSWCSDGLCDDLFKDDCQVCAKERFDFTHDGMQIDDDTKQLISGPDPATGEMQCSGKPEVSNNGVVTGEHFSWQWCPKKLIFNNKEDDEDDASKVKEGTRLRSGSHLMRFDSADVDGDCELEQIVKRDIDYSRKFGVMQKIGVVDSDCADIDPNADQPPGFTGELVLYKQSTDGTLIEITDASGSIGTKRLKDVVRMIERPFRVNGECMAKRWCGQETVDGRPNPVKACGGCQLGNVGVTCLEGDILYIRTPILDRSGTVYSASQ